MKIALICPSSMLYMPYVDNYIKVLDENNVNYTIINWDRFGIEEISEFTYRDNKVGHQRNFFDYYSYYKFVINLLDNKYFDKIIIFGLQMTFFLNRYLSKNYKHKYIIDIRDYNKILKFFNPTEAIENSIFTVISSPGYKLWLPQGDKYIVNHNTQINSLEALRQADVRLKDEEINVAYIGAIRDYDVNINFINSLKNSKNIKLFFHGEGVINEDIKKHINENSINNVWLTGRYNKEEEGLYIKTDLINVLVPNNDVNSKTLLPNRLYNAVLYGKPVIAFEGTYLSKVIKEYNLGLILDSFERAEDKINNYLKDFDEEKYRKGRIIFLEKVLRDNEKFKAKIKEFID